MSKRELLKRMQAVKTAERLISPDKQWVSDARATLMTQVKNSLPAQPMPMPAKAKTAVSMFVRQTVSSVRGPALAVSSIVAAVLGGSLFSVSASERSLPGDLLYPIKIASEQTRLAMAKTKTDKVKLKTEFVERRVSEMKEIVNQPGAQPERVKLAAETLKRDLNTVKQQLKEAKQELPAAETANVAKIVDKATTQVATDLKEMKNDDSLTNVKSTLSEAQVAAVDTSVSAMAVLVEVQKNPDSAISTEEVTQAVAIKVESFKLDLTIATDKLNALPTTTLAPVQINGNSSATIAITVTASSSAEQISSASSSLQQANTYLQENKLDEASLKLVEAAKVLVQADTSIDMVANSASTTPVTPPVEVSASSTDATPTSTSSTNSTTNSAGTSTR